MSHVEFHVSGSLEELSLCGAGIRAMCVEKGADAESAWAIEVSAVEVATNTIKHAYGGAGNIPFRVRLGFSETHVRVEIADTGRALPDGVLENAAMPAIPEEEPDAVPEGGYGLALVLALSESVDYSTTDGWNTFTFVSALHSTRAGGDAPQPDED